MTIKHPSEDPAHPWAVYENQFLMSITNPHTSDRGIRWQLSDVKSVDMHESGRWMIVCLDASTTAWLRIGDDVTTIEFDLQERLEVKPEYQDGRRPRRLRLGRLSVYLEPRDAWVGVYMALDAVYVCPVPFVVLRWKRRNK